MPSKTDLTLDKNNERIGVIGNLYPEPVSFLCQVQRDRTGVEPEWLMGKIGSREGLFPEAFVQPLDEPSSLPVYDSAPKRFAISLCTRR